MPTRERSRSLTRRYAHHKHVAGLVLGETLGFLFRFGCAMPHVWDLISHDPDQAIPPS